MWRILMVLVLACQAMGPASAGAWMREHGTGFTAATATLRQPRDRFEYESAVYTEWGLSPRVTLGFDVNENAGLAGHVLVFARYPLWDLGRHGRFATEIGIGAWHWQSDWAPMHKFTLSYGRGLTTGWGNGWLAVDGALEYRSGEPIRKLDMTVGLSTPRRIDPMLSLETSYARGQMAWTLTPGLTIDRKKDRGTWVIGLERKSALPDQFGFKLGLWKTF
ncbi:hypothetical protein ACFORG_00985 [Lutimaribacter marinistellae]|uniref:Cellulose biosynthesis protein BcsS n=1 Tax=Lutimaribacter marinistellae TaxID=1820329 RepID=A0ABV7TBR5_9RHOB